MPTKNYQPKLNKKCVLRHTDFTVYSVNGFAVRDFAKPNEEFGNFATRAEFPNLIPKNEIWISEKIAAREGVFFIANALTQCKREAEGAKHKAYDDGIAVERLLRTKLTGIDFRDGKPHAEVPQAIYQQEYIRLPDPKGPVVVSIVDGNLVRSYYKTDYTEGGHGYVYPWVPRPEIWIDDGVDRREVPFIVCHEYLERRLMRDRKIEYDTAHEIASRLEFDIRKTAGVNPLLVHGRRRLHKRDLPRLTGEDVFQFVLRNYVRAK